VVGVSHSGYYAWRKRQGRASTRKHWSRTLDERVREAFAARKGRSGSPGVTGDLQASGHRYNRKTVAESMKRQGLRAKAARKFKATTDSHHDRPVAPNRLAQDLHASAPNPKWGGDITCLWTERDWLDPAVVIELYSRRVVGWSLSARMTATLVCDALQMPCGAGTGPAVCSCTPTAGRSTARSATRTCLPNDDLTCSMSAAGNCYDNACAESFFRSLQG